MEECLRGDGSALTSRYNGHPNAVGARNGPFSSRFPIHPPSESLGIALVVLCTISHALTDCLLTLSLAICLYLVCIFGLFSLDLYCYANEMTSTSENRKTNLELERLKQKLQMPPPIPDPKELYTKAQNAIRDGSRFPHHLPPGSKRRRAGSPESDIVETRVGSQGLILPKAIDAGVRPHEYVEPKDESPWNSLQKVYELKLDGYIAVAIRKPPSCELVTVKNLNGTDRDEKVKRLQQTQHENFVTFLEAFHFKGSMYTVHDYVPISLAHLVASPAYPTEPQLAAILGQVSLIFILAGGAIADRYRFWTVSPISPSRNSSTVR